jgi:hypothetical protein
MSVVAFKDVLKASKDLLTKPYNYTNKTEVKTNTGGVEYTAEAVVSKPGELFSRARLEPSVVL